MGFGTNTAFGPTGLSSIQDVGASIQTWKPIVFPSTVNTLNMIQLFPNYFIGMGSGSIAMNVDSFASYEFRVALVEKFRIKSEGDFGLNRTNTTAGSTGNQTINKPAGSVNFAAAATSLVVTNNLVTVNSNIFCQIMTNDATMKSVVVVAGAGSFTITANAAATGEVKVAFWVTN